MEPYLHASICLLVLSEPFCFVTFIIYLIIFMFNETIINGKLITIYFFVL